MAFDRRGLCVADNCYRLMMTYIHTYNHACNPLRVRQRCKKHNWQNVGVLLEYTHILPVMFFKSLVIGGYPIAINRTQIQTP